MAALWLLTAIDSLAVADGLRFETMLLTNAEPAITLQLAYTPGVVPRQSVILMLGSLQAGQPPA
ncbi:MAG TPA: hypothetical protein VHH73_15530, partial [Verrucomicrobiae bacterium]|nr:hypothetical protein [Verrucomicrobiae bacterium]